jgi:hypothetical protein
MSMTNDARQTASRAASRAADNPLLEGFARAGFIGYGVVHILFAWLALQIAFGKSEGAGDQAGALHELAAQPAGRYLVIAIAVGLAAMALWQALEAAVGHRVDRGKERVFERIASAGRALLYIYLAWTGYKVVTAAKSNAGDQSETATAKLMSSSGGRWLVALIGVAVLAIGIGMIVYGLIKRFFKHLMTERMSARMRKISRILGVSGYVAKGAAYAIAGVLVIAAAVTFDPQKARGLDGALRTLVQQPYGGLLLILVAAGIAAFAAFCFVQARYRKV